MKVTIKTLQQTQFTVEVEGTMTVGDLKALIEREKQHPAAWQKLVFAGKILADDATLASCGVKENDFLVLMVRKAPAAPAPAPAAPAPTTTTAPAPAPAATTTTETAPAPAPAPEPAAPAEAPKPAEQPQQPPQPQLQPQQPPQSGNSMAVGSDFERVVTQLCEMGFERDQVMRALRAAYNNPDRAVEYLMSGIPDIPDDAGVPGARRVSPPPPPQQPQQRPDTRRFSTGSDFPVFAGGEGSDSEGEGEEGDLGELGEGSEGEEDDDFMLVDDAGHIIDPYTDEGGFPDYGIPDVGEDHPALGGPRTGGGAHPAGGAVPQMPGVAPGGGFAMPGVVAAPGEQAPPQAPPSATTGTQPAVPPTGGAGGDAESALAFLRQNPQFQQMRVLLQQQPQLLPAILQSLAQTNPQLFALINQHQDEFAALLNESGPAGGADQQPRQPGRPEGTQIQVTPEERAAIERLEGLGFDRALVIQAYFACDKNEELAANWLLEHGGDM